MYELFIEEEALEFLNKLPNKSQRIINKNLKALTEYPYPGRGRGDKEKIERKNRIIYRIHIGRTWTAIYRILDKEKIVRVLYLTTTEKAHKIYGRL
jgi:mRNA-degrading endonuclease RelE of RelBE toxin-antitoxin system